MKYVNRAAFSLLLLVVIFSYQTPALGFETGLEPILNKIAQNYQSVVSLGSAIDAETGLPTQGYAFITYPSSLSAQVDSNLFSNTSLNITSNNCYSFLLGPVGIKWKNIEPWIFNPTNNDGLTASFLLTNLEQDINKWEDAADGIIGSGTNTQILGTGSTTYATLSVDVFAPDGQNEVYFGNIGSGAIAIAIVWGNFTGPKKSQRLLEWDQIYDDVAYDWSSNGSLNAMDFENIATHELGHAIGLADLYSPSCANETMYGFASYGETNKRTLEAGDIMGVNTLY